MKKSSGVTDNVSGKGLKIGIIVSRFNREISEKLLEGAQKTLLQKGVREKDIQIHWVPGAFEIPFLLQTLARRKKFHALIALGAVIRGETPHFDYVAGECARGVMDVSLREKIPVAFGVLTTNTIEQAIDRAGGRHGNKGVDMALVALEMVALV